MHVVDGPRGGHTRAFGLPQNLYEGKQEPKGREGLGKQYLLCIHMHLASGEIQQPVST